MGQTCCRPVVAKDVTGQENWKQTNDTPTIGTLSDLPPTLRADDSDDEFWEARSHGSMSVYSTTSNLSYLSMDDLLDQYQEDLDGDIHDLDAEIQEAALTGGHLVPKEIEDAATEGKELPTTIEAASSWFPLFKRSSGKQDTSDSIPVVHVSSIDDAGAAPTTLTEIPLKAETETPLPSFFSSETTLTDLQHVKELIKYARLLEAHELLLKLCEECNKNLLSGQVEKVSLSSLTPHSPALGIDIAALETEIHAVHAALDSLDNDSGWMVSRKGDFRVLYSHKKGTTQHSLKFHAVFPHPVEHILSLAHEWDLLPTWNKFSADAIKLAEPSIFESIVYGAQWMMKPIRHMEAIVRARGFDLAASPLHRCLLITIEDVNDEEILALDIENRFPHLTAAMEKRNRVNILKTSCIKLRPLPPKFEKTKNIQRTEAHLVVHLDPHIPYVPSSLVNFVLGILAPYIYNQMLKVLDNAFKEVDGEFPRRVRDQPELYGLVERRMAEFADQLTPTTD